MFIVFDGIDGAGKTTQLARLAERLRKMGRPVTTVRDPGGTPVGEAVREILLNRKDLDTHPRCEVLLLLAARAQTVESLIRPALAAGSIVLSDRYTSSTLAYQGYGSGYDLAELRQLCDIAVGGLWPDKTLIFDMDESAARGRLNRPADRIESRGAEYLHRVAEGFRTLVRTEPGQYHRLEASGTPEEVERRVSAAIGI